MTFQIFENFHPYAPKAHSPPTLRYENTQILLASSFSWISPIAFLYINMPSPPIMRIHDFGLVFLGRKNPDPWFLCTYSNILNMQITWRRWRSFSDLSQWPYHNFRSVQHSFAQHQTNFTKLYPICSVSATIIFNPFISFLTILLTSFQSHILCPIRLTRREIHCSWVLADKTYPIFSTSNSGKVVRIKYEILL